MALETRLLMGMPITVEIVDDVSPDLFSAAFAYFEWVDERFSLYRPDSEISRLNSGRLAQSKISDAMREVLEIAGNTLAESHGYFDIRRPHGGIDPSGIVKGWSIRNAADLLRGAGARNFYVDAGGDIQSCGLNARGEAWTVGIRNPFAIGEIIKTVAPGGRGVATSGTSARGQHIYNPHDPGRPIDEVVSLTVIGADVLEADRFATAAFAMGRAGIAFIEGTPGLEGYLVDRAARATFTSGLEAYLTP
jgi:thiamine biosynthesis lipoprotein